ncbi:MAG: response regulator [Acidaminobacteraceae bacterium]
MRLLLIEDDKTTINILRKKIEALGINFDYAETGSDSINYYRSKRYEIIVIDLNFPGKDVFEILLEINLTSPDTNIIVYSSNLDSKISAPLSAYDIHDIFLKEAGHEKLINSIKAIQLNILTK